MKFFIYSILFKFNFYLFSKKFININILFIFEINEGIGDWGLGIGDWAQSPIPNPQSPIPNPHIIKHYKLNFN